jgi:hypothetical protein
VSNYTWRAYGRARRFFDVVEQKARSFSGSKKGFLFEVAAVDIDALVSAAGKITEAKSNNTTRKAQPEEDVVLNADEDEAVRRYLRLFTFGEHGALALTTNRDMFVSYRQPAVKPPFDATTEVPQYLLVRLINRPGRLHWLDAAEVFDFLFDEVYYDSRVRLPTTALPNYDKYLTDLKKTTLEQLLRENGNCEVRLSDPERVIAAQFRKRATELGITARLSAIVAFRKQLIARS